MYEKTRTFSDSKQRDSCETLLDDEARDLGYDDYKLNTKCSRSSRRYLSYLIHIFILALYTALFAAAWANLPIQKNCHEDMIFSPARDAVTYVRKPANDENDATGKSPYAGYPSPESDAAWGKLLKNSNIRLSEEELREMNRTSIKLQDGSGMYGAGLQVHHHLHCLKSLRQMVYRDHYGIPDEPAQWAHLDHCLDDLRLALMCNADISYLTYDWLPEYRRPWANFHTDRECVDWEKLDAWAGSRSYSLFDRETVVHPELGLSYPLDANGKPDTDPRIRPSAADFEALRQGTNPKGNWGPEL